MSVPAKGFLPIETTVATMHYEAKTGIFGMAALDDFAPVLAALDMLDDNVVVLDREWRYLFVNQAMLKLNGFEKSKVLGRPYWEVFPEVVGTPLDTAIKQAFELLQKTSMEFYNPETHRWYQVDIVPSAALLVVRSVDITERKLTTELNRRLTRSLDSISDPILMMDRSWRYSFVNQAGAEFVGRSRAAILGQNIWELSPWLRDTAFGRGSRRAMAGSEPFSIEDYYRPRARWLSVQYFPGPDGFTVHIADIHDLKRAQQQMSDVVSGRPGLLQLRAAFDLMPQPVMMIDADMRYTYANAAGMAPNHRTLEQLLGAVIWELNPALKGSELVRRCFDAFETRERQQFEFLLPPSGRWFQVDAFPWHDQVVVAAVDITKLKQSELSVGILTSTLEQALSDAWNRPSAREAGKRPPDGETR
jgi:PAS domain S-box-containing protein